MKYNRFTQKLTLSLLLGISVLYPSCRKDDFGEQIISQPGYIPGPGLFIINEGNFGSGNASLTFRNDNNGKTFQEIYRHANGHPLGDVAVSMSILGDTGIIVVNNSGLVEFVKLSTMKSIASITGLPSPRHCVHDSRYTYVSDLMRGEIHIIDRNSMALSGSIPTHKSVENMLIVNGLLYATCWSSYYVNAPNNNLLVIDLVSRTVVDSIQLSKEPNSMVKDQNGNLWVLCSGGFLGEELPKLHHINLQTRSVVTSFTFSSCCDYPTSLRINRNGNILYFLNMGVYEMDIMAAQLPSSAIFQGGGYLYGLACDPVSDRIITTDAVDFQRAGKAYILNMQGQAVDSIATGIGPSYVCFRL